MWQVAVAAAVAGSGLLAKHLFSSSNTPPGSPLPEPLKSNEEEGSRSLRLAAEETLTLTLTPTPSPPSPDQTGGTSEPDPYVFRFSSSGSARSRSAHILRSKPRVLRSSKAGGLGKVNANQWNRGGGFRDGRKRVPTVRRVSLFFKKRKTAKNCTGKRDFNCSTESPSFGWGLGIGIMYMMSTGKEEIGKLSDAVDETSKVVHELKAELYRRRSRHRELSSSPNGSMQVIGQGNNAVERLKAGPSDTKAFSSPGVEDGENASSILTEELVPDETDMDWLEAELESELQKLPSFVDQVSDEGRITRDCSENRAFHGPSTSPFFQPQGVSPAELSEKLSDVLIKQQESHISELLFELKLAHSKLQQRESELDALKDCVKRLTEFSISDEEAEACQEQRLISQ